MWVVSNSTEYFDYGSEQSTEKLPFLSEFTSIHYSLKQPTGFDIRSHWITYYLCCKTDKQP